MTRYVLDTNIVSLLVRQTPAIITHFDAHLIPENQFLACPMVWYEVKRGLLLRDAKQQTTRFTALFHLFDWDDFNQADWALAAELWDARIRSGRPMKDDHDLMIAVFTRRREAVLVTHNVKDFDSLGVRIENWV